MPSALILYDQDCGFCRWCLAKLLAWDRRGRLRPVPIGTPEADRILGEMPRDRQMSSWHLLAPDGRLYSAGLGFAPLFRLLPGGWPFASLAARSPRLSERGYRWMANRRSRFGRLLSDGAKRRADRRIAARSGRRGRR